MTSPTFLTCGQCTHAKLSDARNLTQRLCKGAPPTAIALPGPGQSIMIKGFYPPVQSSDEACGAFVSIVVSEQISRMQLMSDPKPPRDFSDTNPSKMAFDPLARAPRFTTAPTVISDDTDPTVTRPLTS